MRYASRRGSMRIVAGLVGLLAVGWLSAVTAAESPIDFERARQLLQKEQRGETFLRRTSSSI